MGLPGSLATTMARLCHLKKWEHFQGYGFNLHTDKSKAQEGQLVGNVDPGSPALQAGVKKGDRIIEVRGRAASSNPLVRFP